MTGSVRYRAWQFTTDLSITRAEQIFGDTWVAVPLRAKHNPVQQVGEHQYQALGSGWVVNVRFSALGEGGTNVEASLASARVTQSKFLMIIPLGAKKVAGQRILDVVFGEQFNDALLEADLSAEATPVDAYL